MSFLEVDPYFFRSGYIKADLLRHLKRAPLTRSQEQRLRNVILARLSTGVVSLEPDLRIRTANHAASAILGVNLETHVGESIVKLAESALSGMSARPAGL